jgi:hypothetical protein
MSSFVEAALDNRFRFAERPGGGKPRPYFALFVFCGASRQTRRCVPGNTPLQPSFPLPCPSLPFVRFVPSW